MEHTAERNSPRLARMCSVWKPCLQWCLSILCAACAAQAQLGDGADKRRHVDDDVPALAYELALAVRRGLLRERAVAHAVGRWPPQSARCRRAGRRRSRWRRARAWRSAARDVRRRGQHSGLGEPCAVAADEQSGARDEIELRGDAQRLEPREAEVHAALPREASLEARPA